MYITGYVNLYYYYLLLLCVHGLHMVVSVYAAARLPSSFGRAFNFLQRVAMFRENIRYTSHARAP